MGLSILIIILWSTLSILSVIDYIPYIKELNILNRFAVFFIFTIGGPIFGINQILTMLLDCIFPEGWDDEDDFNEKH